MKFITAIIGILLVVFGSASLAYQAYVYKTGEKVTQIGSVIITDKIENLAVSPLWAGLAMALGIILMIAARTGGK